MARKYWQIAAESKGREYADEFILFGMAFVGGNDQCATMATVDAGDVILLKRGLSKVVAVGEVVERNGKHGGDGDKQWLRDFDGWDLRSYCYVDWRVPENPVRTEGLTRATIQQILQSEHKAIGDQLLQLPVKPFSPEPPQAEAVTDDEILRFLIAEGLRPSAADDLTDTFRRIRLLAKYYYDECEDKWDEIREHETRTFLIVPLLLALGWAEQQLKIEFPAGGGRGRVDTVCFSRPFHRKDKECVALIEAKAFSSGLYYAVDQAKRYAQDFPSCTALVVSNGYCYRAYRRTEAGIFSERLSAYLNILSPTKAYHLDPVNVGGALDVLRLLMPISLR
jgi:hypothetical protein